MMYKLYILVLFSFVFSISFERYQSNFYNQDSILNYDSKYDTRDVINSLLLPGWSQYSKGEYNTCTKQQKTSQLCVRSCLWPGRTGMRVQSDDLVGARELR